MLKYEYQPLTAQDYVALADVAVRAKEKNQLDIADIIMERMELDLVLIGSTTIQKERNVNIDHLD
jgi:hypothetical protein